MPIPADMPSAGGRLRHTHAPLAEALEDRILHSADLAPLALTGSGLDAALHAPLAAAPGADLQSQRQEIVFIDASLPDAETLLADLHAQRDAGRALEIVTFGADDDALALIGQTLAGRQGIDAVHVISHGSDGVLQLGKVRFDADTLLRRAGEIAGWSAALGEDADLLLYGCDLAATDLGRALAADLAALTGADVAASVDLTGAAALGGDWELEFATGAVEAVSITTPEVQVAWSGVLDTYNADPTKADGATGSLRWAISQANAHAGADEVVLVAGTYTLTLTGSGENANAYGDLDVLGDTTFTGAGAASTIVSGGNQTAVLHIIGGTTTMSGVTIANGKLSGNGPGVDVNAGATLHLSQAIVRNNESTTGDAGGIFNKGVVTLTDVEIRDNIAGDQGGGIYHQGTTLTLERVTIAGNTAWQGAGLYSTGTAPTLSNVTVSGNTSGQRGGGLYLASNATLLNVTIAGNSASSSGGGGGIYTDTARPGVTLRNVVLSSNTNGNLNKNGNTSGVTSLGNNLSSANNAELNQASDLKSTNPLLGSLQDNGGATRTHALLSGSPAINVGNTAAAPAADQRGVARVGAADIGAYEHVPVNQAPTVSAIANQTIDEDTATAALAFTIGDAETDPTLLTVTAVSSNAALLPAGGIVLGGSGANRTIVLTPAADANSVRNGGTATVTVTVSDGSLQATRVFTLTVNPVADDPVAVDDSASTPANTPIDVLVLANDHDVDGDTLALNSAAIDDVANGSVAIVGNAIRYTPSPTASGAVTISYTAIAGGVVSNVATLTVNVGANTPPTATGNTVTLAEDDSVSIVEGQLGYADGDAQALAALRIDTLPVLGTLTLDGAAVTAGGVVPAASLAAGKLVYTPPPDANGAAYASFTFSVQDTGGAFSAASATLVFDVTAVADSPRTQNDTANTAINQAVEVRVLDNDTHPDGLALTLSSVTLDDPTQGTAVISTAMDARGAVLFTPAANVTGPVQMRCTVSDPSAATGDGQLVVTVGANTAPTSADLTLSLAEDGSYAVRDTDISFADADSGQTWAALRIASLPTAGSLLINGVDAEVGDSVTPAQLAGGAMVFHPAADANGVGYSSLQFNVVDSGGELSAAYTMDFDVSAVNDAPLNSLPATSITGRNVELVFSAANGNAIGVGDVDIDGGEMHITLSVSAGTLTLADTAGLSFASGTDGSAAMAFTGTLASIDAALDGLRLTPAAGFTGSVSLTLISNDQGGSGGGGALADTDVLTISVVNSALWLTTEGNTTSSAGSGGLSWDKGQVVELGNPNLALGGGTSGGTFGTSFNLNAFAQDGGADLVGLHVVGRAVSVGTVGTVNLQAGDVLFSVAGNETLGGVAVTKQQVILFRPGSPGDYSAGTFSVVFTNPDAVDKDIRDFALVETAMSVGGTALQAGDFLLSMDSGSYDKDIWLFRPSNVGSNPASGSLTEFINGASAFVNLDGDQIRGVELVQQDIVIGGKSLTAGQLLLSQDGDGLVGGNLLSVKDGDIFVLSVTQTGLLSAGTASMFMRGSDLGLGGNGERPDGIALVQRASASPVIVLGADTPLYTEDGGPVNVAPLATVSDADSASFTGGRLTVYMESNTSIDDRLAVQDVGSGAGQIGVSGSDVSFGGIVIGSVAGGGDGHTPLTVTLNANASAAATQALLNAVMFSNISDTPATLARRLAVVLTDGGGGVSATVGRDIAVAAVNDDPSGLPLITGTVTEDQTLGVNTAGIADADGLGAFAYQWLRDGVAIDSATASTYTLGDADVGAAISVTVSYTDGQGTAESLTSAATASVANVNDDPSGLPLITGTVTEDQTLGVNTAGIADADGLGAFAYQWLRDGVAIDSATASTYTLGDADVGAAISVTVSYTDGQGTAESLTSAATASVANVNDDPSGLPLITGTVTEDQTLGVNTAGIADADGLGAFAYQWLRDGVAIDSATASTYTLGDADVGAAISVTVSYTDGQGTAESLTSAATASVANVNDDPSGLPLITGTVTEDQTLGVNTAGIADADGLGAFAYQWLRDGVAIDGATASTYTLGDADVGAAISVTVSYTDGQGTAESLTSAATASVANVNDDPTGLPRSRGTATEDQTLGVEHAGIADVDGLGAFATSGCATAWPSAAPPPRPTRWATPTSVRPSACTVSYTDGQRHRRGRDQHGHRCGGQRQRRAHRPARDHWHRRRAATC